MDQETFDAYMRRLPYDEPCRLMITSAVRLCSFAGRCPYQGRDRYHYQGKEWPECRREAVLRYKRILGELDRKRT